MTQAFGLCSGFVDARDSHSASKNLQLSDDSASALLIWAHLFAGMLYSQKSLR